MFAWLQHWVYKRSAERWTARAYEPLFILSDSCEEHHERLEAMMGFFETRKKELLATVNKDESAIIKDRYQALQIDKILDHYRTVLDKLEELMLNTPERPETQRQFKIDFYNDINSDD